MVISVFSNSLLMIVGACEVGVVYFGITLHLPTGYMHAYTHINCIIKVC